MKILHVADLHYRQPWLDWISAHAGDYDLLCIAGDLQDGFLDVGLRAQAEHLSAWLLQLPVPTVVCTGNHDYWPIDDRVTDVHAGGSWLKMLAGKGNIIAVDGQVAEFGGLKIAVLGWDQVLTWPENTQIVVCHAPPAGSPVAGSRTGPIDPAMWEVFVERPPRLFLCGHIHEPSNQWCWAPQYTTQTLVLNPGCSFSAATPNRWEIDTASGVAVWHGSGSTEVRFPPL